MNCQPDANGHTTLDNVNADDIAANNLPVIHEMPHAQLVRALDVLNLRAQCKTDAIVVVPQTDTPLTNAQLNGAFGVFALSVVAFGILSFAIAVAALNSNRKI